MTEAEARELEELEQGLLADLEECDRLLIEAGEAAKRARHKMLRIHDRGLWKAHAGTWKDYYQRVLRLAERRCFRELKRARLERILSRERGLPPGQFMKDFSDFSELLELSRNQAEVLWAFPVEVQLEAWRRAVAAGDTDPAALQAHCLEVAAALLNLRLQLGAGPDPEPGKRGKGRQRVPVQPLMRLINQLGAIMKTAGHLPGDWEQQFSEALRPALALLERWQTGG